LGANSFACCLKTLRVGDTPIIWKLDRLGRGLRDLITTLDDLRDRAIHIHSFTENIDTETLTGRAMCDFDNAAFTVSKSHAPLECSCRLSVLYKSKPRLGSVQSAKTPFTDEEIVCQTARVGLDFQQRTSVCSDIRAAGHPVA
jgi:hypothetical protein